MGDMTKNVCNLFQIFLKTLFKLFMYIIKSNFSEIFYVRVHLYKVSSVNLLKIKIFKCKRIERIRCR